MLIIDKARELIKDRAYDHRGATRKCYFVTIDGNEYALLIYKCSDEEKNNLRLETTNYLQNLGVGTPGIVGIDYCDGYAYELQQKCDGKLMAFRSIEDVGGADEYIEDFLKTLNILNNADSSVFLKLMNSTRLLYINGYDVDCHSDNYMIDNNGNITFIDLDIYHKPEAKDDKFMCYINVLPNIFSFALIVLRSSSNSKYVDACISLLKSIGYKWLEQCVNYLSSYGFTNEEIIKQVAGISFNYFMIDKAEKDNMITSYFSNNVSEKRKQ